MALMVMSFVAPVQTINAATPSVATRSSNDIYLLLKGSNSTNTGNSTEGGARRARARISYSSVEARIHNGVLFFDNEYDLHDVEIRIVDEYDDIVLSSVIDVMADEDNTIDISSLPIGYYTLYVIVNGAEYYATFEM